MDFLQSTVMQGASRAVAMRAFEGLGWLLGVAVFAYLLAFPRVLGRADESFILYGAQRLLQGQAMYKDFFEFITPGSFYFFAALFTVTGPSLLVARVAMAVVNAVSCILLFQLTRRVAAVPEACIVVVLFAATCLPVWPYASPHWLSTMLCLATATVLLSERRAEPTSLQALVVGVLTGTTFCVQQHRGVVLGLWVIAALVGTSFHSTSQDRWRRWRRDVGSVAGGWLIVTTIIFGYSTWRASLASVIYGTFTFVFGNYYPSVHGAELVGYMPWAGVCMLCGDVVPYVWRGMLRSFPAILVIAALPLAWVMRRSPTRRDVICGCVWLLAVLMSLSILYYPDFIHVAFIAPFPLMAAAWLAYGVRSLPVWGRRRFAQVIPGVMFVAVLVAAARKGLANIDYARLQAPERFQSAVGTLAGTAADRQLLNSVQHVLAHRGSNRKTLFSYPGDAWLYLAVPADNPTRFELLYPGYNSADQFQEVIEALRQRPADCLVVNFGLVHPGDLVVESQLDRYVRIVEMGFYEIYERRS